MIDSSNSNHVSFDISNIKPNPLKAFQIIEKLGEGTYASVYKAFDKITDKVVAIKMFPKNTDQFAYLNEIESLRAFDHPYIVKLLDIYSTAEEIWLILEYCQLGSLYDILRITKQTLSEPEIAHFCYSILSALDYIHIKNKIHRDIKMANILVNSFGEVKLTDFGVSSKKLQSDSFMGSLLWMAPEMVNGMSYNQSVDIWALGICVIEMAEGNAPFHHLHLVRAKFAIQKKPQTQFTEPSLFSSEFNDFLSKCLQVEPARRWTAFQLLSHSFILKFKKDMPSIRQKFCQERVPKLEEYKRKVIIRGKSDSFRVLEESIHDNVLKVDNLEQLRSMSRKDTINGSVIEHPSPNQSQTNLTFIEKSSMSLGENNSLIANQENYRKNVALSNIKCAIDYINTTEPNRIQSERQEIIPLPMEDYEFNVTDSQSYSQAQSLKEQQFKDQDFLNQERSDGKNHMQIFYNHIQTANHDALTFNKEIKNKVPEHDYPANNPISQKQKMSKPKMYKMPHESNFVVKHRVSETVLATHLNQSIDTETTLNPISLDRQKYEYQQSLEGSPAINIIKRISEINKETPSVSIRDYSPSTAAESNTASAYPKSGMHTSNPSFNIKEFCIYKNQREFLEPPVVSIYGKSLEKAKDNKMKIDQEKVKIEQMMKKELEIIEKKYKDMLKSLETEN